MSSRGIPPVGAGWMRQQGCLLHTWMAASLFIYAAVGAGADPPPASQPGSSDIAALVARLGDPSYASRSEATRQLCAIGAAARPALERAVREGEPEVAMRARSLLKAFDNLFFSGCRIELAVSGAGIRWDEPLDLHVRVRNESDFDASAPFEPLGTTAAPPASAAEQVGRLLDLADFLRVVHADGTEVNFHIDPITDDAAVEKAVRERAEEGPTSRIPAGGEMKWVAGEFNRGMARYPLLRAGRYAIQVTYQPEWDDEELARAGAGAVSSNTVEVIVTEAAPPEVKAAGASPSLVLEREGDQVVVLVQNASDLPIRVNANLSAAGPPFARLRWSVADGEDWRELTLHGDAERGSFAPERLLSIHAGNRREIARVDIAALRAAAAAVKGEPRVMRATYSNLFDAGWQRGHLDELPDQARGPLPQRVVTVTAVAEPLRID